MGYQVVSVSGGEPLMYHGLETVLAHARSLGMRTTVTTNGFFIKPERIKRLRELVDVLAISLDGPPETHNEIRGSTRAFELLKTGLGHLREAGIPFGLIHTLTGARWEDLFWVAEFAASNGARLFQIHPLELTGRATTSLKEARLDEETISKAYLLAFVLGQRYRESMKVQVDLLHRSHIDEEPHLVYMNTIEGDLDRFAPAQLLGLLVLEADGTVVPISYGFARHYRICNINEQRLASAWREYLHDRYHTFRSLCRRVYDELCDPRTPPLFNWHETILARSHTDRDRSR
jgi:MoaA/NifB/PqqE/SkfB family radical SAM enzyme